MEIVFCLIGLFFMFAGFSIAYDSVLPSQRGFPKFNNPPPNKKKRYRWNIYWEVWDEWDEKEKCYLSNYPAPIIVSRKLAPFVPVSKPKD